MSLEIETILSGFGGTRHCALGAERGDCGLHVSRVSGVVSGGWGERGGRPASDFTSITSYIHNWVLFLLWLLSLHSFWSHFSTDLQLHMGAYESGEFTFQCPIFFAFSYCSWGSQGKNTEMVCHSLLQRTMFCQNYPP